METLLSKLKKIDILSILFVIYTVKLIALGTGYEDVCVLGLFLGYFGFNRHLEFKKSVKEQKDINALQNQLNTLNSIISNSNLGKIVKRDEQKVRKF